MLENSHTQLLPPIDINNGKPLSSLVIQAFKKQLKSKFRTYLDYILGLLVMGTVVTYRALSLDFDKDLELLRVSLYIGFSLGFFTGLMTSGNAKRRIKMIIASITVSTSASLFCGMLVTLLSGKLVEWISSISILGGALGCMWILTRYDVVVKELESLDLVDEKEFTFIKKAGQRFEEVNQFNHKIAKQKRIPTIGEFWAIEEWLHNQPDSN